MPLALQTRCGPLTLASPLMNASGAFNAELFSRLFPLSETLGAVVTKTVTREPRPGNPQQRTVELPGIGMLNAIGLQNPGLAACLAEELPKLAVHQTPVIVSISAYTPDAFAEMSQAVFAYPNAGSVCAIEMNLSCPNVDQGGVEFGSVPALVKEAVSAVRAACGDRPVFAKLTPNVASMVPMAEAALEGGATGLTAINTVLGAAIDIRRKRPALPRVSAGYSGPGIKPIALHHVWQLRAHFPQAPIIGVGGIHSAEDVLEFLLAGATCVQVGTACFRHPDVFARIVEALAAYCRQEGLASLSELVGAAHG